MYFHRIFRMTLSVSTVLIGVTLGYGVANAYNNPGLSLNIKRVDSEGKITLLKPEKNVAWTMTPNLCFQMELSDPSLGANPNQWKISKESDATASVKGQNLQTCLKNKISSFTVSTSATAVHYLTEVITPNPQLALSANCPFEKVSAKLSGDFLGVGLECKMPTPNVVNLRAHFGTFPGRTLQIYYQQRRWTNQEFSLNAMSSNPIILQVGDEKNHVYGIITLQMPKSAATPTPVPTATPKPVVAPTPVPKPVVYQDPSSPYYIPFELALGGTSQTSDALFPSASTFDQSRKKTFLQIRAYRRAKLLNFKTGVLSNLMYEVHARADVASEQNIEGWVGILKPVKIFKSLNTLLGLDLQYATSLGTPYGIKKFVGGGFELQIEMPDRRVGARFNFAYAGSASYKFDSLLFYTPPWRALRGTYFGVDYGYLSFPYASTNAIYDFKQTRIGLEIGYRFGTR